MEFDSLPDWQREGMRHVWMPYCQMQTAAPPTPVVATDDVYLILADGRRLIDGLASWWTACHGYNHPHIRTCVAAQLHQMPHVMFGGIQHEPALRLATRLAAILPGDLNHVFFSDSGSVAVEVAMKMAVQYWRNRGDVGRSKFVCFRNAYHGDTTGAMSVCDPVNSMHAHFAGWLPEQFCQPVPTSPMEIAAFADVIRDRRDAIAAVIIEPLVQGAGGMRFHSADVLRGIRDACRQHDVLFIADEIATGFGRTGTMFACEQADIVPDLMCIGKALTGGTLGMAATIATSHVYQQFLSDRQSAALAHGPTFMANPLACVAANASLDLFATEPRLEQVLVIERNFEDKLSACRGLPGVIDVRCKGGIGVIQVNELHHLERLRSEFVRAGVWLRPFHDMIYLTPPLTITPDQLETLCRAVVDVVGAWSGWSRDA